MTAGYTVGAVADAAARRARQLARGSASIAIRRQEFDPAALGFSPAALQLMNGYSYLPLMTFGAFSTTNANSTIASLGSQRSDWSDGFIAADGHVLGRADA